MVAWPTGQPTANLGVVVQDDMDVQLLRNVRFDELKEPQELLWPTLALALGEHLPVGDVQGSEQGGGAVRT
jgi:hypothetical protein